MNKVLLSALFFLTSCLYGFGQAVTEKELKAVIKLEIPYEGGANGAAVAWHPVLKKYYAAMAGNVDFPMVVFDATGKKLSDEKLKTQFDVRGFWYNPLSKSLQANGYNDFGWAEYKLNSKGFPASVNVLIEEMHQPTEQSTGAFNPTEKVVYFLNEDGDVDVYDGKDASLKKSIALYLGLTEDEDDGLSDNSDVLENYNTTTVIYTGIKGAELGLLNVTDNKIELYNLADGYLSKRLSLPSDIITESWLNFSYSNRTFWIFNKETRVWTGYR